MRYSLVVMLLSLQLFAATAPKQVGAFEQGRRQYETGKYSRALDLFSQAINQATDATARNKAYYYQGLVLFELGLYYSSFSSFKNVLLTADDKNKEVYEKAIKNAVIITDRLDMADKVGKILDKLPSNYVPSSVAGLAHYAIGVSDFKNGNADNALSHFKSVAPENQFYDKSLLYLGALETKKKNYKEAVFYFGKLIENTKSKRDAYWLQELGKLNYARTLYSMGEIEKSIESYAQFLSTSPHWITVLLEASWPLMRVNDTTVSLGNLHTITSPFYREELVGEAYILRSTILFSLCKYEEMRRTLAQFFNIYDPVMRAMQQESTSMGGPDGYFRAFTTEKGLNRSFMNFAKRDEGIKKDLKVLELLREERRNMQRYSRSDQMQRLSGLVEEAEKTLSLEIGSTLQKLHKRKLAELAEQREQANYLKVEIVTGEKEMIEGQKGLPPKRLVDVETSVAAGFHFWPFTGEYWEDELGTYVYTTESSCVN